MRPSRSLLFAPVPGRDEVLLVQPLTRQVALLTPAVAAGLQSWSPGAAPPADLPLDALREGGFVVVDDEADRALLAEAYADWQAELAATPTQLLVVPTFGCNLRCTYCYQEPMGVDARGLMSPATLEALFRYVDRHHAHETPRPYLTAFGGEPLIDVPAHRAWLAQLLDGARARGLTVAVVTNGYDLEAYVPLLAAGPVREVQVTLDGPPALHDRRRPRPDGTGSFARAEAGIDALVAAGLPVNLRVVADRENLGALADLAARARAHGWLDLPASRFKTQVGRNYELFGCTSRQRPDVLFDRTELWTEYLRLAGLHPDLARFHRPRLHGMRHLAETGEFPPPNFDACPATKKEWAFGPDGGVWGCTATVGHPGYRLGSFAPEEHLDEAAIARWRDRSVFTIPGCADCVEAPLCGGGCGALAAAQHGDFLRPDCRPVRALLGLGAGYYRFGE